MGDMLSVNSDGNVCQRWDTQSPNTHSYTDADMVDGSLAAAENYCRVPVGSSRPWCYSADAWSWNYCDLSFPMCGMFSFTHNDP